MSLSIYNLATSYCDVHSDLVHTTTHESCIKVTILVFGWCQAISTKSKWQMRPVHVQVQLISFQILQITGNNSHRKRDQLCNQCITIQLNIYTFVYIYTNEYIHNPTNTCTAHNHGHTHNSRRPHIRIDMCM